ncbi:MAG TPA: LytTR family DNA-binding domain-containing protein [Bacteroidia bacterium]|nr:LytTR family DNA-binding domain-containing protein [Bacteroidia bacterium]
MQVMNCLIVEDESLAADVIRDYVHQVPGLKLCGICRDVFSAMEKLRDEDIHLIFLDIHLPKINGLDFIKTINGKYDIILTTAYHQYALEGFNLNVTDYLLKPVEFSRFLQAVNKVFEKNKSSSSPPAKETPGRKYYFFNVDKNQVKVFADEILYIESLKDYVRIHTKEKKLITKFQLGEIHKLLNSTNFIRIHKSFIVNSDKITSYNAGEIEISGSALPIGRTYKELVEKKLTGNNLL